jgi:hypothetical protein
VNAVASRHYCRRTVALSTHQEMIHARNAVDTLAHDFVANRELLLSVLSAFAQSCR